MLSFCSVDDMAMQWVNVQKYLNIFIDDNLTWIAQVQTHKLLLILDLLKAQVFILIFDNIVDRLLGPILFRLCSSSVGTRFY